MLARSLRLAQKLFVSEKVPHGLLLPNEVRNGLIRGVTTWTCLGQCCLAPGVTWTPSCFLGVVKVCGEEFKPTADRLCFCLWVL